MASSEDWRSESFRNKFSQQINDAKQSSSSCDLSPEEMENKLYNQAKSREEYVALVAKFVNQLKDEDKDNDEQPPSLATEAVLVKSESLPEGTPTVKGYDFNGGVDYHKLLQSYARSGFQAQNFGKAVEEINKMIDCKLRPVAKENLKDLNLHPTGRPQTNCSIFLSYTSNLISAGVREVLRYLVQHNMVDCIVTTAGGIEEDFIKCMAPTYMGEFSLRGKELRDRGINRIGNLLVPNDNYCKFEDWLMPILDQMLKEQREENVLWTPSRMIDRLGKEINNPDSVYYWAHKNNIPVYCPAITDGSLGDMIYFHSYKNPGLVLDLVQDIRGINSIAVQSVNSGLADTLGSVGVIISSGLIHYFGWMVADPVCSMFIATLITVSVLPLLRDSVGILMQRTPRELDHLLPGCYQRVSQLEGVYSVQEPHFWTLCSEVYIGTIKLEVSAKADSKYILSQTHSIFLQAGVKQLYVQIDHAIM